MVINTESGAIIEWPPLELERARMRVVLSDDLALVEVFRADIEAGIYLLERESGDLTLLVPGQLQQNIQNFQQVSFEHSTTLNRA